MPEPATIRPGSLGGIANLRDVGGLPTTDGGRVRTGLLYRGPAVEGFNDAQVAAFTALGIRTVYDLRTVDERSSAPDELPAGTTYVSVDVLGNDQTFSHRELVEMMGDPASAAANLGGGRGTAIWQLQSRNLITLETARAGYGRLLRELTDEARRPAMVHCSTGKDRTGWAVTALLTLLGVPDELVTAEYLRSNDELRDRSQRTLDRFAAIGGDPEVLRPITYVQLTYLETARAEMRRVYGDIEGYFANGLGIDQAGQAALREIFVERAD